MGIIAWPRGSDGLPLHHAAQIDLTDLPASHVPKGFPKTGVFALFIKTTRGAPEGKAVFLRDTRGGSRRPPSDLPPLFQDVEGYEVVTSDRIYQRYALEILPLRQDTAQDETAADIQMAALFIQQPSIRACPPIGAGTKCSALAIRFRPRPVCIPNSVT